MSATLRIHNAQPLNAAVRVTREPSGETHVLPAGEALPMALDAGDKLVIEIIADAAEPVDATPAEESAAPAKPSRQLRRKPD